jgi:hypothetical protein
MIWTVLWWVGMYFAAGTFVYWLVFVWDERTPVYNPKYLISLWLIWLPVVLVAIWLALFKLIFNGHSHK